MTEASRPADQFVYFFGFDEALRAALAEQARLRGVAWRNGQTVAGLMHVARIRPPRVLLMQTDGLPAGRSVAAILDRLESETGRRPHLIGLAPASGAHPGPEPAPGAAWREAVATFRAPFDAVRIMDRAVAALAHRTPKPQRLLFLDAAQGEGEGLAEALREEGFRVERLTEPSQTIARLEARLADLVILDLCLPEDTSRALSEALRTHPRLRRLPILFLAAESGPDGAAPRLRLGQDEYLARPITPAQLAAAVRGRLARAARELRDLREGVKRSVPERVGLASDGGNSDEQRVLTWLTKALTGPGFFLVYQPILSLRRHHGRYEVLLRLTTPTGKILTPLRFLPVAARHGLLPALDRWVLGAALRTLRRERDAGRRTRLVVFQSGASLGEPGWLDGLRAEVARLDLIRQRPALEFNVRDILDHEDQARVLFPELGRLGIEVCLAGVTDQRDCLGLIARRPIGTAKLSRELVTSRDTPRLAALVEAVHQRRARVIAAGIEDPDAIGRVWSTGVDYIQGNFIQPPRETLNFAFDEGLTG